MKTSQRALLTAAALFLGVVFYQNCGKGLQVQKLVQQGSLETPPSAQGDPRDSNPIDLSVDDPNEDVGSPPGTNPNTGPTNPSNPSNPSLPSTIGKVGNARGNVDPNCFSNPLYDACLFYKNPVAHIGQPVLGGVRDTTPLSKVQTFGVRLDGVQSDSMGLHDDVFYVLPQIEIHHV